MVVSCFGRFDILIIVFFEELESINEFIKEELPQIKGINNIEPYFILEDKKTDKDIFSGTSYGNKPLSLDEMDQKIIIELMQDGRPNYTVLAKKLGISKPTVSRRISYLLKKSIIRILAIPDPSKLDYSANAYILVNIEHEKIENACNLLANYPEVHLIMKLVNDFDMLLGIFSTSLITLYKFVEHMLWNIDGVQKTETLICGDFFNFNSNAVFNLDNVSKT